MMDKKKRNNIPTHEQIIKNFEKACAFNEQIGLFDQVKPFYENTKASTHKTEGAKKATSKGRASKETTINQAK
jgi:hypothetical protein